MNLQEIKELINLLNNTDISEFDLESEGMRISIRKGRTAASAIANDTAPAVAGTAVATDNVPVSDAPFALQLASCPQSELNGNYKYIKSPMVGTFYISAGPETPPFIEVGQQVKSGQTVCIIEAMKLMNEIESDFDGKIVEVLVNNAQPVEFGQPLLAVAT